MIGRSHVGGGQISVRIMRHLNQIPIVAPIETLTFGATASYRFLITSAPRAVLVPQLEYFSVVLKHESIGKIKFLS